MNILVSECLLGIRCKYSGGGKPLPDGHSGSQGGAA